MRVCVLAHSGWDGDARIEREAKSLAKQGAIVDVFCLRLPGHSKIETYENITLYRGVLYKRPARPASMLFQLLHFFFASFVWVFKMQLRHRYDVVHVHTVPDFQVFAAVIPKLRGAKVVLDMHEILPELFARKFDLPLDHRFIRLIRLTEKLSVKFADHVIIASPLFKKRVAARTGQADKITPIINMPDLSLFDGIEKAGKRRDGKLRLIYPGTFSHLHGVDIAVRAVHIAHTVHKIDLELHLYGSGPEKESLQRLVHELDIQGIVKFHRILQIKELYRVLVNMDIGLIPKRSGTFADDALSTKLFEYAAAGLCAIVSRTPSDMLFFDESMAGFFEAGNASDLARRIVELAADEEKRKQIAGNARRVFETVNWEQLEKEFLRIFDIEVKETGQEQESAGYSYADAA